MKKILLFLTLFLSVFTLVSCGGTNNSVVISKISTNQPNIADVVLELHNPTNKDVSLQNYTVRTLPATGQTQDKNKVVSFSKDKKIAKNGYFIIVNRLATTTLKNAVHPDLVSRNLVFGASSSVGLYYNDKLVDIIGNKTGLNESNYMQNMILSKLDDSKPSLNFNFLDYVGFIYNEYKVYRTSINGKFEASDLDKGPIFDKSTLDKPYYTNDGGVLTANGGSVEVKVNNYVDGDTTIFGILNKSTDFNIFKDDDKYDPNNFSVRYLFIDTRESTPIGGYQPWGKVGSLYTDTMLENAKHIYVQSVKGMQVTENHGRVLGLVWADDRLDQAYLARAGLTDVTIPDTYLDTSNIKGYNISNAFLIKAAYYIAIKEKLRIHGDKTDPTYNYNTNNFYPANSTFGYANYPVDTYGFYNLTTKVQFE